MSNIVEETVEIQRKGTWLTVRDDVKIVDCTVRDGGLVNDYHFSDEFVKAVYDTCVISGVDYFEIGKIVSKKVMSPDEYGVWNFCDEEDIRRIVGDNNQDIKIAVMADIGRTFKEEIKPKSESVIDMIRVACYIHQIPAALDIIEDAHQKGYETTINIMAISKVSGIVLDEALELVKGSNVDVIYLVDSFGTFYSEQIRDLTVKYTALAKSCNKSVGIHAHNNQQLAYSNTIESMIGGTSYLDATIAGLGRGAGNCPMELLFGFLRNPKFRILPILDFIQKHIIALRKEITWGYDIPYMITGQLNEHPRSAIGFNKQKRSDYSRLYNELTDAEE
ncbi:nucleoid-structuring protein H-NS [Thiospirochaeta perfilievii]|uniref:Nucleoid-structuring protein H-NS n=1 Tax=Thiospirochaeta perfilievii TaxID=252967 RepID=A0A5C1QEE6_9SPIO|nr:aldolase catalytic domain-containing protein [Thiospirochaeta perfilievii]QEN05084.1 nucleoid-structuring protein H-NS [Thiospirochaeta perfilievii]